MWKQLVLLLAVFALAQTAPLQELARALEGVVREELEFELNERQEDNNDNDDQNQNRSFYLVKGNE